MYIIDTEEFVVDEVLEDFWLDEEGNLTNPICAAGSRDAEIVLGVSITESKSTCLHYYNRLTATD